MSSTLLIFVITAIIIAGIAIIQAIRRRRRIKIETIVFCPGDDLEKIEHTHDPIQCFIGAERRFIGNKEIHDFIRHNARKDAFPRAKRALIVFDRSNKPKKNTILALIANLQKKTPHATIAVFVKNEDIFKSDVEEYCSRQIVDIDISKVKVRDIEDAFGAKGRWLLQEIE